MTYFVRRTAPAEAREHLLPLWLGNLPIEGDPDEKLRWFYEDSPHGAGRAFLLECAAASPAVGAAGIGVRTLYYEGQPLRAALFADFAVDAAHRTGLPALMLLRAVRAEVGASFDLGYGFPNAKAAPVYRRAGYAELGTMVRYVRVLRSSEYVGRVLRSSDCLRRLRPAARVARTLGVVVDRTLSLVARRRERAALDSHYLRWLDEPDERFDGLWRVARRTFPLVCERTATFLRWRFCRQPGRRYRFAALIARATRDLVAYAVIHDAGGVANIVDMLAARPSDLDLLLRRLVAELDRRGLRSVAVRFLGAPLIPHLLAAQGFIARKRDGHTVCLALGDARLRDNKLHDASRWYLTDLDEDW